VDPKERFTDRVETYTKARPGYPAELVDLLRNDCGLTGTSIVADIGSGTGMLSRLLAEHAHTVYGVEPNDAMREASQQYLAGRKNFIAMKAAAENTGLPATSMDLITVAQAFHWFDQSEARHEFMRILKPNGFAVLIWNNRRMSGSPLAEAYEQLLVDFGTDYKDVQSRGKATLENMERFFGHSQIKKASIPNSQDLDRESFVARAISASYMPNESHPRYGEMVTAARRIFDENRSGGYVVLEYDTSVYYAQMS
jgi:ubiquinone/menaquinone biosynthesis C-methylase UbiE